MMDGLGSVSRKQKEQEEGKGFKGRDGSLLVFMTTYSDRHRYSDQAFREIKLSSLNYTQNYELRAFTLSIGKH